MESRNGRRGEGRPSRVARLRVLVVDDHPIVREGLRHLINDEDDMVVCGEADTAELAMELAGKERPDVAIVDLSLGLDDGLALVRTLAAWHPDVRVLVLSMHDEMLYAERALRAGALGYVMKRGAMPDLLTAIRRVAAGRTHVSGDVAERLVDRLASHLPSRAPVDPIEALSNRERQVFELIGRGLATREIADHLNVSVKTIESHQARIKDKLGLRTSRELIRKAVTWSES